MNHPTKGINLSVKEAKNSPTNTPTVRKRVKNTKRSTKKMKSFIIVLFCVSTVTCDQGITRQTKLGLIKGVSSSVTINNDTKNFIVFKKIPFAKPPVGDLRFQKPVLYGPWNGILDATNFGPSCIQPRMQPFEQLLPNINQSEDCLFLNIYTPIEASMSNRKSVMIWIHGGGFQFGQGMLYDGSYLSVVGDVIVVTINYRLNVFGFFTTMDDAATGNYGLWDQQLAIQWVHDNIESFGGDPKSITIVGESAGAHSVALQAINPINRGLFHRIIQQSGTSISLLATDPEPQIESDKLVHVLNCTRQSTSQILNCLRNKDSTEIFNALISIKTVVPSSTDVNIRQTFVPSIDGIFLKYAPSNIIRNQSSFGYEFYKSLDTIIGVCEGEGSLLIGPVGDLQKYLSFNISEGISSDFLCNHILPQLVKDFFNNNTAISETICRKYATRGTLHEQGLKATDFFGDLFFVSPAVESINAHASNNHRTKQFQYLYKRRSFLSLPLEMYPWFKEAGHASEIPFLFPFKQFKVDFSEDMSLSLMMMKYWSNFAKSGDVNGDGLPKWPQYDVTSKQYNLLDVNVTLQNNLYKDRMDFWLTQMMQNQTPTTPCTSPGCIFG